MHKKGKDGTWKRLQPGMIIGMPGEEAAAFGSVVAVQG